MALYIIVKHAEDRTGAYTNSWKGLLLEEIHTNDKVQAECEKAMQNNEYIYVYRCKYKKDEPKITCKVKVKEITKLSDTLFKIQFTDPKGIFITPQWRANQGDLIRHEDGI